jgi:hypothetical protein
MSYDILAFDSAATTDAAFSEWWDGQSQWLEDHSYDTPDVTTSALQAFYADLIRDFPPMNGPGAPTDQEIERDPSLEARLTDYSIGTQLVYAGFSWSQEQSARTRFQQLADAHGVAVAMVSDDGRIIRPTAADAGSKRRWPWGKR